ncbi:MAG TPA: hypothetical protein VF595_06510 [Tepidisphaeraceae bacterium]
MARVQCRVAMAADVPDEIPQSDAVESAAPYAAAPMPRSAPTRSLLDNPRVASALGILASIVVHAGLIILGLLLIPQVREAVTGRTVAEQTIVPTAELATDQVGGIPNPGLTDDKSRAAAQNTDSQVKPSDAWAERSSATLDKQLVGGAGDAAPTQIGIGGSKSAGGRGLGDGVAGGGGLAKFGVPGGGSGIGPRGAVFGNGGNAYRIVFVCDGTGDMVSSVAYPVLLRELNATMAKLKPKQQFNVVFFYDGTKYASVDANGLLPAIPANTEKLQTFLKNFSGGSKTDPLPAIKFAFSLKPDLIYFLSNGNFDDLSPYDEVKATFRKLNPTNAVRVNTVLLTAADVQEKTTANYKEALKDAADTMSVIAKANGGRFLSIDARRVYLTGQ